MAKRANTLNLPTIIQLKQYKQPSKLYFPIVCFLFLESLQYSDVVVHMNSNFDKTDCYMSIYVSFFFIVQMITISIYSKKSCYLFFTFVL